MPRVTTSTGLILLMLDGTTVVLIMPYIYIFYLFIFVEITGMRKVLYIYIKKKKIEKFDPFYVSIYPLKNGYRKYCKYIIKPA